MQYFWKLYKWENGIDRVEMTEYLSAPVFLELRCNEQLPTGEIILDNMPTSAFEKPFSPKTKFTLERWVGDDMQRYFDFVVDHDDVEHYAGLSDICCHRIYLIDPSVYAQGLHCDNFSLTYEQNDSTLNYKTVISSTDKTVLTDDKSTRGNGFERPNWKYGTSGIGPGTGDGYYNTSVTSNTTTRYTNSFDYRWTDLSPLIVNRNLNGLIENEISFTMPIIKCYANNGSAVQTFLFDCPTRCRVKRTKLKNGVAISGTTVTVVNKLYNPIDVQNTNDRFMYNKSGKAGLCGTWTGKFNQEIPSTADTHRVLKVFSEGDITNLPAMINTNNTGDASRTVTFKTTPLTTQDFANKFSYEYKIELTIEPYESGAIVLQYTATANTVYKKPTIPILFNGSVDYDISYSNYVTASPSSFIASTVFLCRNMLEDAPSNPFLIKGRKYNCYDLFRRAMLTCDTRVFDNKVMGLDEMRDSNNQEIGIQYPIVVHSDWAQRLKEATMFESVFENKNLWEVLQQIGHYLHAIPYLEFARNGKSQFALKFRQLGGTKYGNNNSTKITIFNSQNLSNFFTQYDAYVTNIFSPQNEVDEWLVCKTSDNSYLVSNNTAELHTKYGITELVEFDITYKGQTKSALEFVFEKTVYDVLSSQIDLVPAKWSALYFTLGDNKIRGLNYVPPTPNNDGYMALKTIVGRVFNNNVTDADLKFNNLRFHVKYKTQDTLRLNQIRPDIEQFMKSSEFENYPHHEQFFNQQDKIIDSERFSANLWGRLVRVANGVYQCQEYADIGQEKEPGDLITIGNESYYVTECECEYYADAIFQKVTYSKNFNQLSNIVTIPSEPRFFEISERSLIRREIRMFDFIKLSSQANSTAPKLRFVNNSKWHGFIRDLLFADNGNPQMPNFAYTNYKADIKRNHYNLPNNDTSVMFPSSEAKVENGIAQPKPSTQSRAVIVPLLHFPLRNAIVFEWDMEDNFKAADCIDKDVSGKNDIVDEAYYSLQPVRYCDVYGRADLFDFKLFYKNDWSDDQVKRLPFAGGGDFAPTEQQATILIPESLSIGLDKDNREALSFNYQINLLHDPHDSETGGFIIFSNLFGTKNGRLRVVLLNTEVSMFDEAVRFDANAIVADNVQYSFTNLQNSIRVDFARPANADLNAVKSIVFYDIENTNRYAYIAKNVASNLESDKLRSWYIYPVFN